MFTQLTRAIESTKEEHKHSDQGDLGAVVIRHQEGKATAQQAPGHLRKCAEQQVPSAKSIHGVDRREGEDE